MIAVRWYWLGLIACLSLLGIAYFYFQRQLGLPPCPLCMFQRAALVGIAGVCLVGIMLRPKVFGSKVLALLGSLFAALGGAIAGRQVWLQNLPADQVPACGPDLEFMLDAFPLMQVIETVLLGSGECADIQWQLLGLSMPAWMVGIFTVMFLLCVRLLLIRERRYFNKPYVGE
ncbi:MAG: disulfide bond formation protein B [Gammaproteobacteria bacterium]|nr:disulfide bond formation protein B [Gammaproteobacteria bacterium]